MPHDLARPRASGAFTAPAGELATALLAPVLATLSELGTIRVDGPDTLRFLQSQLTNDVEDLDTSAFQLNGYCTVKGRLLATFHQWRDGDAVILQLPGDILATVQRRLTMFVLRSKVKLADHSDRSISYGLLGVGAAEALRASGLLVPEMPGTSIAEMGVRVSRLRPAPRAQERFLLSVDSSNVLPVGLNDIARVASDVWWWSEIDAAVPTVFAATQEKFVPQMINFEVLGGVDFKKGCYPGQEIVARSQYLGKLKRRMRPANVNADDPPLAGSDIVHSSDGQAVGTVVMSARAPGGGSDLLFEAPIDRLEAGTLHLGDSSGAMLQVRPLPYALFDPTA
jgi:tRNA-modifying protein YgfZ